MIALILNIFRTCFEGNIHEGFFANFFRIDDHLTLAIKLEGDRSDAREITPIFSHGAANFRCGAVFIIGCDLHYYTDTPCTVAFVNKFFVDHAW